MSAPEDRIWMTRNPPSTPAPAGHRYTTRIYYEDTDAGGVVYHAVYLGIIERARTEALRELGVPHADLTATFGLLFVVRRVAIDYVAPAGLDDVLVVVTRASRIGGASLVLRQTVLRDERMLADAEVSLVCVRPGVAFGVAPGGTPGVAPGVASGVLPGVRPDLWRDVRRDSGPSGTFIPARIPDRWRIALAGIAAGET